MRPLAISGTPDGLGGVTPSQLAVGTVMLVGLVFLLKRYG